MKPQMNMDNHGFFQIIRVHLWFYFSFISLTI